VVFGKDEEFPTKNHASPCREDELKGSAIYDFNVDAATSNCTSPRDNPTYQGLLVSLEYATRAIR
jgi:hypothetical protein